MTDFHRVHCTHCGQTFLTLVGETKCDLCGKVGGLTDPDSAVAERIQREMQREPDHPPGTTHATLDELIDDPSASPARKVLTLLGILALFNGLLLYKFWFRRNAPPAWFAISLVVVSNVLVLVIYIWRSRRAAHLDAIRRNTPAATPPDRESVPGGSEGAPTDSIRSATDSVRRP